MSSIARALITYLFDYYYYAATGPPLVLRQVKNYFFDGRPRCGGVAGSGGCPR
jgi:hypothetical protein